MSTFYVGQRVRIVSCRTWPELNGREATIESIRPSRRTLASCIQHGVFYRMAPDCWGGIKSPLPISRLDGHVANYFNADASQIEPIVPEGWKVTDWDKCLWQPEGEIA